VLISTAVLAWRGRRLDLQRRRRGVPWRPRRRRYVADTRPGPRSV
jgi:hypothetical protein